METRASELIDRPRCLLSFVKKTWKLRLKRTSLHYLFVDFAQQVRQVCSLSIAHKRRHSASLMTPASQVRGKTSVLPKQNRQDQHECCYCGGKSGCAITGQLMIASVARRPPT